MCVFFLSEWRSALFLPLFLMVSSWPSSYNHYISAPFSRSFSSFLSCSSETTWSAGPNSVLITDPLCSYGWFESQFRYWSVCVGFLYTWILVDPSFFTVSKKAIALFSGSSMVNVMLLSMLLICSVNSVRHIFEGLWRCRPHISAIRLEWWLLLTMLNNNHHSVCIYIFYLPSIICYASTVTL